jgi:hypothetical protein
MCITIDAQPTSKEMKVYELVQKTLARGADVLTLLNDYKGCQDLARKAMSSPTAENETAAFTGLLGAVDSIASFFEFSKELERCLPELLITLAVPPTDESKQSLADQQVLYPTITINIVSLITIPRFSFMCVDPPNI